MIQSRILPVLILPLAWIHAAPTRTRPENCLADVIRADTPLLMRRATTNWSYEGAQGPAHWGILSSNTCATGRFQSPVDFEGDTFAVSKGPDVSGWGDLLASFSVKNTGRVVQLQVNESQPPLWTGVPAEGWDGMDSYRVQNLHFHSPGEHHVDGKYFPLEAHIVQSSGAGKISIIGLFFDLGPSNLWFDQFLPQVPIHANTSTKIQGLELQPLIAHLQTSSYFHYTGSLTMPPCTEDVAWFVAREPLTVSDSQLAVLRGAVPYNARPTQENASAAFKRMLHWTRQQFVDGVRSLTEASKARPRRSWRAKKQP
ncbi:alpha carbonic anhydrase [Chytriomyces sp. MP71]|nr:alpha carbonic anhydrase [Chytriomyces sp. MP71]